MKFDQELFLNLQYDFGKMNSTLGSVVPLAMSLLCDNFSTFNSFWELEKNMKHFHREMGPRCKKLSSWFGIEVLTEKVTVKDCNGV